MIIGKNKNLKIPISNVLIQKYFDEKSNLKTLHEISNMNSLDEVFENYTYVIIFMAIRAPNDGHWVCMFKNSSNLYYFDSYGKYPLIELNNLKNKFGQTFRLLELIKKSQYKNSFYYNNIKYQNSGDDIATCGRYVVTVVFLNLIYIKQAKPFNFIVLKYIMENWKQKWGLSYDQIVSAIIDKNG